MEEGMKWGGRRRIEYLQESEPDTKNKTSVKKKKSPHPQGAHTLVGEESFELSYENHSMRKHTTGVRVICNQVCGTPSGPAGSRGLRQVGPGASVRRPPWLSRSPAEGLLSADTGAHWTLLASSRDGWIRPVLCIGTLRVSGLPQITGEPPGLPSCVSCRFLPHLHSCLSLSRMNKKRNTFSFNIDLMSCLK